jgi:hypothetical protein
MRCSARDVFAVLADGWTYGGWVVGSARIRGVDAAWPAVGSRIHHSVGLWPVLIDDTTVVERVDAPRRLQLRVRAWPTGEGRVVLTCEPDRDGTRVTMHERAVSGPVVLLPRPLQDLLLTPRNRETLHRLALLAEHRASPAGRSSTMTRSSAAGPY